MIRFFVLFLLYLYKNLPYSWGFVKFLFWRDLIM